MMTNTLQGDASVQDLAPALVEGLDLPSPSGLLRALRPHDCQYCMQQVSGTEWKLIRFFTFLHRTKIAGVPEACGECEILVLARLKTPTLAKARVTDWICWIGRLVLVEAESKAGFEHINKYGPVGSAQNQNLIWAESQT
eukprot:4229273-Amphidinium_carterae.1